MNLSQAEEQSKKLDLKLELLSFLPKGSKEFRKVKKDADEIAEFLKTNFLGLT